QIAMIGKALAQKSKLMILDEPTAFLDYNNRRKIMHLLKELAQNNKQLIFISSHDIELCFEYCNRIIAIDNKTQELIQFMAPFDKKEVIKSVFGE
ncbi:MAG TPA: ABC transporter ATP-binding protein, partial [Brumimicrobium sp.]|nr:ABC transporter ATP-binding protein [Brumimicrobium sp.]